MENGPMRVDTLMLGIQGAHHYHQDNQERSRISISSVYILIHPRIETCHLRIKSYVAMVLCILGVIIIIKTKYELESN